MSTERMYEIATEQHVKPMVDYFYSPMETQIMQRHQAKRKKQLARLRSMSEAAREALL